MEHIAIIGMSAIGISMGLALKKAAFTNTKIIGASTNRLVLSHANEVNAFDKIGIDIRHAVTEARMVIIDSTPTETTKLLKTIGPVIKSDCTVTETCILKNKVTEFANNNLENSSNFVSGRPLIKTHLTEIRQANPNLFKNTNYCLTPSPETNPESIKLVVGLVETLGAKPFFISSEEHDSYTIALSAIPNILTSNFLGMIISNPGLEDISKLVEPELLNPDYNLVKNIDESDYTNRKLISYWVNKITKQIESYNRAVESEEEDPTNIRVTLKNQIKQIEDMNKNTSHHKISGSGTVLAKTVFGNSLVEKYLNSQKKLINDTKDKGPILNETNCN